MKLAEEIRQSLRRWRDDDPQVRDAAVEKSIRQLRYLGPAVLGVHGVVWLGLYWLSDPDPTAVAEGHWRAGLLWLHGGAALTMAALTALTWRAYLASEPLRHRALPTATALAGLLWSNGIAVVDQWVTPNISPFILSTLAVCAIIRLSPRTALWVYSLNYAVFHVGLGYTQSSPSLLLSNRIGGLAATAVSVALAGMLWRNFATIRTQQRELARANAELQARQEELQHLSRFDALTGLNNRKTVVEAAEAELLRARRQGIATSIMVIDMDYFKQINDTWGHPAGDAALRLAAATLKGQLRVTDTLGRLGGEEFVVLLPATAQDGARTVAEKLRAAIADHPLLWSGQGVPMTVSIGVATAPAGEGRAFDSLYADADHALYRAKHSGRNRVEMAA